MKVKDAVLNNYMDNWMGGSNSLTYSIEKSCICQVNIIISYL